MKNGTYLTSDLVSGEPTHGRNQASFSPKCDYPLRSTRRVRTPTHAVSVSLANAKSQTVPEHQKMLNQCADDWTYNEPDAKDNQH